MGLSKQLTLERRPRMLKDFLGDDSNSNSCSSSGFQLFPRKNPINQESCIEHLNSRKYRLQRSRSKASTATISAFHAVIHAVKNIHLTQVKLKSPSILPRSLSRKLSSRRHSSRDGGKELNRVDFRAVTVKDIMRWKSFRDLAEEKEKEMSPAAGFPFASSTATTTPCSSRSNGSSWCESDFTAECLPEECGEKFLPGVGKDSTEATTAAAAESVVGPKGEWDYEDEEEQHSPVSVLGFQDEDEDEPISSFNQSLANMERTKQELMQKIQYFEYLAKIDHANLKERMSSMEEQTSSSDEEDDDDVDEEKAKKLLDHVKGLSSLGSGMDELLLDFFREEVGRNKKHGRSNEDEMVKVAKAWMNGDRRMVVGWEEEKRGIFIEDMGRGGWSSKFEEEHEQLVSEVEGAILNNLLDEILVDDGLFLW